MLISIGGYTLWWLVKGWRGEEEQGRREGERWKEAKLISLTEYLGEMGNGEERGGREGN